MLQVQQSQVFPIERVHWSNKAQNMQIKLQASQEDLQQGNLPFLFWIWN